MLQHLNLFPDNDATLKMVIDNQFELDAQKVQLTLQHFGYANFQSALNELQVCDDEIYLTQNAYKDLVQHHNDNFTGGLIPETTAKDVTEMLRYIKNLFEQRCNHIVDAMAGVYIRNARVIHDRVHFTGAKLREVFQSIAASLNANALVESELLKKVDVANRIENILNDQDMIHPNDATTHFTLRSNPVIADSFLWVTLSYKKCNNAQAHFETFFLSPEDKVLLWLPRQSRSTTRDEVDVMIQLSLAVLPPITAIAERFQKNSDYEWNNHFVKMPTSKEFQPLLGNTDQDNIPDYLAVLQQVQAEYCSMVEEIANNREKPTNPNKYARTIDPLDMKCTIIYCHKGCHICRTTNHSYSECPMRHCRICNEKNASHPPKSCPKSCKCNLGPPHREENCKTGLKSIRQKRGRPNPTPQTPQTNASPKGPSQEWQTNNVAKSSAASQQSGAIAGNQSTNKTPQTNRQNPFGALNPEEHLDHTDAGPQPDRGQLSHNHSTVDHSQHQVSQASQQELEEALDFMLSQDGTSDGQSQATQSPRSDYSKLPTKSSLGTNQSGRRSQDVSTEDGSDNSEPEFFENAEDTPTQADVPTDPDDNNSDSQEPMSSIGSFTTPSGFHIPGTRAKKGIGSTSLSQNSMSSIGSFQTPSGFQIHSNRPKPGIAKEPTTPNQGQTERNKSTPMSQTRGRDGPRIFSPPSTASTPGISPSTKPPSTPLRLNSKKGKRTDADLRLQSNRSLARRPWRQTKEAILR